MRLEMLYQQSIGSDPIKIYVNADVLEEGPGMVVVGYYHPITGEWERRAVPK